jgi:antitoxin VapB
MPETLLIPIYRVCGLLLPPVLLISNILFWEVITMETAKIFENGRSQAVRLPKKFRFNTDEVIVQQLGDAVILVPKESMWQTFMDGLNSFTDDIFEGGRDQGVQEEREHL